MPENVENQYSAVGGNVKGYGFGYRHIQTLLIFSVAAMLYIMRASMSVAIIAMTDKGKNLTGVETYEWDKKTQDFVLSSFFWGYALNQIPGAQLAHKYGGKIVLLAALLSNSLISIVTPYAVSMGGWKAACASRALQGLTQAPLFPSIHTLLSKWIPINERSRLGNFIMAGGSFGMLVSMPLTGFLSGKYGWPIMFQTLGAATLLIAMSWYFYGTDRPAKHSSISWEERNFIETSIGHVERNKAPKTPWKSIFTSGPVLALLITQVGMNWCFLTMFLETPSFINKVLGINMKDSGLYMAIPYITMWVFGLIISVIADLLIVKNIFSVQTTRKIANTICAWSYVIGLPILCFIPKEQVLLSMVCLTLIIGLSSGMVVGVMLNHLELAPNFAGILMGITNSIANGIGNFAAITVGYLLDDPTDSSQWRKVFLLTAAIAFFTNLPFQIWGTSDKQEWNEPKPESQKTEIEMKQIALNGDTNKALLKP